MDTVVAIPKSSRLDSTLSALSALILTGRIESGALLPSEAELCKQLGVSRPTIREAVRILQSRGLVIAEHGVGVRVIDRTAEVASDSIARMIARKGARPEDVLEVRLMLECQAAALAALRATPDEVIAIQGTIDQMARDTGRPDENARLDLDFHVKVAEASHNIILLMLVNAIRDVLFETISATHALNPTIDSRIFRHTLVLDAIRNHDQDAAYQAMKSHLDETRELIDLVEATSGELEGGAIRPTAR